MLRCYEPAHIAGVSKTAYAPATPRCLDWRHDSQPPARTRSRRTRRSRSSACSVVAAASSARSASVRGASAPSRRPRGAVAVRSARPTAPSPTARRSSTTTIPGVANLDPDSARRPAPGRDGRRRRRRRVPRQQRLALPGVPGRSCSARRSSKYGSEAEAARWVATPDTSAHVSGDAVDIGPADATAWLSEHGAAYGLCQIYGNEPWHYELRPEAVDARLPADVRRPHARPEDAAVTTTWTARPPSP